MHLKSIPFTRRSVVLGLAAATASVSLSDWLAAQPVPAARPKRCEIGTANGKAMLQLFSQAVLKMQQEHPLHDPLNWQFQANIHDHPDGDDDEFFVVPAGASPQEKAAIEAHRALAVGANGNVQIWKTCSHFGYPEHFLTWHRMYLYFFERIVEKVVGQPFAMPYWAYIPGNDGHRRLPDALLSKTLNGHDNPLWFAARNEDFVSGGITSPGDVDFSTAFQEHRLLPGGGRDGFTALLEDVPHNQVHGAVGTPDGMGATTMAARDPIFWLHHANIDRLWESWRLADAHGASNRDPLNNSQWLQHPKFAFAGPDGERIEMTLQDAVAASSKLGVKYDNLEPAEAMMGMAGDSDVVAQSTTLSKTPQAGTAQITKKGVPVSVGLAPAVAPPIALGFGARPQTRYDLIVEVETTKAPGALYDVIMTVPKAPGSSETEDRVVGTFNLFGIEHSQHAGHAGGQALTRTWKTEITDLVRQKLVDPTKTGDVSFRARYADPAVPVTVKSVRIEAR